MVDVIHEWAGKERLFRLTFGGVLDLEEATGTGVGEIFIHVASGRFKVGYVFHTIRLALIGGGASILDAKRIMDNHFDTRPYLENAVVAGEILTQLMSGIEEVKTDRDDERDGTARHKFSEVSQICRLFNMSPQDLRDMRYADYVNMVRGYNAGNASKIPHISEEEFLDILNRYEPETGQ